MNMLIANKSVVHQQFHFMTLINHVLQVITWTKINSTSISCYKQHASTVTLMRPQS